MKPLYGNAVVGQSGGPTVAINATLSGVIRGVLQNGQSQIQTLYGMVNGIEGFLREDFFDLTGYFQKNPEKLKILEQTPAAVLGSCRKKLPNPEDNPSFYETLISLFKKYNIRYFFYIGGNDSMDTVAKLSVYLSNDKYEMRVIGVPKTIDNDLAITDHAPGFGSAAKFIAVTMREIIRDCAVYRTPAVTIVEIMGRDAGWLTASAALGRLIDGVEPDLIYLPERNFTIERFLDDVRTIQKKKPNVVVAVSEGVRFPDGHYVGEGAQNGVKDIFGHAYLAGVGKVLEESVRNSIGCKVRSFELSLPQRCAAHISSATDIRESLKIGKASVGATLKGVSGEVMIFVRKQDEPYRIQVRHVPSAQVANQIRKVNDSYINSEGNCVTDECCRYLLPLIQGELPMKYRNGLPEHLVLF